MAMWTVHQAKEERVLGPEELVRRETRVVNFLRAFLCVLLVIVASFLSLGCYKLTSSWEEQAYRKDFNAIALRFESGFSKAVSQANWAANAIGVTISAGAELGKAVPNLTSPFFYSQAFGVTVDIHVNNVFFAPLLQGEEERKEWEAYARQQMNETTNFGSTNICNVCGSPDLEIGKPKALVAIPGYITFTCGEVDQFGSSGEIPAGACSAAQSYVKADCGCRLKSNETNSSTSNETRTSHNEIFEISGNGTTPVQGPGPYWPIWQVYPQSNANVFAMYDLSSDPITQLTLATMKNIREPIISKTYSQMTPSLWSLLGPGMRPTWGNLMFVPVYADPDSRIVIGSIVLDLDFTFLVGYDVPLGSEGIRIVLENTCGQKRTFQSDGTTVFSVGDGDLHDPTFSSMMGQLPFDDYSQLQRGANPNHGDDTTSLNCLYRVTVYSSEEFRSLYISNKPSLYAGAVILIFVFTSIVFVIYDCYVARRQRKLMEAVMQRDEIVSSLFPAVVRQRLFQSNQQTRKGLQRGKSRRFYPFSPSDRHEIVDVAALSRADPIADFLPMVSIVFADISGFTAWSSEREPEQVFQLLETVYQAFDRLACRSGVFKVETTGDCYVAATGIPVYQADHAVRIIKFAYECLLHMHELVHELETTLGPGTSSLSIRIGVHSGPVIAGVLRGDKTRFQLFGDTMNTAARMETTGQVNMIQISTATADLLTEANKAHWIRPRNEHVSVKGKGLCKTYWADPILSEDGNETRSQSFSVETTSGGTLAHWGDTKLSDRLSSKMSPNDKIRRIVEWNTDLLLRFLRNIVATRIRPARRRLNNGRRNSMSLRYETPFADVTEILPVPQFSDKSSDDDVDPDSVDVGDTVQSQLRDYIAKIASMYRDNPFHNFEHACHVAMSASKIVMRIIRPNVEYQHDSLANKKGRVAFRKKVHQSTFGISSDVLMQFAVVFSAVIHDVDHTGVSNAQLTKEGQEVALRYDNKCVAEQNSVDIAWNLLMEDQYKELRKCICQTEQDLMRFRQLLVNAVIATDIADKELQLKRKKRWDKAFTSLENVVETKNDMDRKATIVFEYIIQASDVSHTMQHWKVYKLWNERLFEERYRAYQCGREEQDPSVGWYKGEIGFFDNYIIPLAKKLETCGVFGVSSDEYLSYALENRREWELKGEEIVRGMVDKYGASRPLDPTIELDV